MNNLLTSKWYLVWLVVLLGIGVLAYQVHSTLGIGSVAVVLIALVALKAWRLLARRKHTRH